ncbi:hypothetical protein [Sphingomonas sp.]
MDDDQFLSAQRKIRLIMCGGAAGGLCGLFWRELFHHLAALWR